MIQIGDEVIYKRSGYNWLGVVTAISGDMIYVLLGHGMSVMGVDEGCLTKTGVCYGDLGEMLGCLRERHLCVSGKLSGWRKIMPKENVVDPEEGVIETIYAS